MTKYSFGGMRLGTRMFIPDEPQHRIGPDLAHYNRKERDNTEKWALKCTAQGAKEGEIGKRKWRCKTGRCYPVKEDEYGNREFDYTAQERRGVWVFCDLRDPSDPYSLSPDMDIGDDDGMNDDDNDDKNRNRNKNIDYATAVASIKKEEVEVLEIKPKEDGREKRDKHGLKSMKPGEKRFFTDEELNMKPGQIHRFCRHYNFRNLGKKWEARRHTDVYKTPDGKTHIRDGMLVICTAQGRMRTN